MTLNQGARLGRYEIRSLIGVGGMGEAYRAHDRKIGREVAIKVLPVAPYAVTADGQRFLLNTLVDESGAAPVTVVVNWTAKLKQ